MIAIDYSRIPVAGLAHDLRLYVERHAQPNAFLRALLSNDLRGACTHGDDDCRNKLAELLMFCEAEMPIRCWGTPAIVDRWLSGHFDETAARQPQAA